MKLVTVDQMRSIETAADAGGHTFAQMMELAGRAVALAIQDRLEVSGQKILLLVGPGNNGGDGLVAARVLKDAGAEVGVILPKSRADHLINALRERNVFIAASADEPDSRAWLSTCAVIVDALLGTGTARPISGDIAKLLKVINVAVSARRAQPTSTLASLSWPGLASPAPLIVAVDGPTGLNYDTGELDPLALSADISVTFACPKIGHIKFPGAGACGELIVADIGIDPKLVDKIELELADASLIRALLPARPIDAHKGTFGKVLIAAGSIEYTGAPVLSALAAYRSGAGLVTLASPRSIHSIVTGKINEATFLPLPDRAGALSAAAVFPFIESAKTYDGLLIGPGLSLKSRGFVVKLLSLGREAWHNVVIDADALNILAQIDHWWTQVPAPAILTPHPGEMLRLTRISPEALAADRVGMARKFAALWGHVVVLKGAFTVIAAPDNRTMIMPFANPALATAGSGDVLAGSIVALRGQGLPAYEAAIVGTYLHGLAGEMARREMGSSGVMAGDLLNRLPRAISICSMPNLGRVG